LTMHDRIGFCKFANILLRTALITQTRTFSPIGVITSQGKPSIPSAWGSSAFLEGRNDAPDRKLCALVLLIVLLVSAVSADEPKLEPKPEPSGTSTRTMAYTSGGI